MSQYPLTLTGDEIRGIARSGVRSLTRPLTPATARYQPGDHLWARAAWRATRAWRDFETGIMEDIEPTEPSVIRQAIRERSVAYYSGQLPLRIYTVADDEWCGGAEERGFKLRPAVTLPKWATPFTLTLTRIERDAERPTLTLHFSKRDGPPDAA